MNKYGIWFAFVLMALALAGSASAQVTASGGSGSGEYPTLAAALGAIGSGDYRITVSENQVLAPYTVPLGQNITLASSGGERTIQLASVGSLFTIDMVATLTLEDGVTLKGISANNAPVVLVKQGGIFYMNGGKITGNTVSAGVTGTNRAGGVGAAGRFDMYGGEISGNTMAGSGAMGGAGGVLVVSMEGFLMTGGTISGNLNATVNSSGNGAGGVYVSDGRFEMRGGTIRENRQTGDMARAAGGVYLANASNMYMYGGIIEENSSSVSSSGNGDGVFVIGTSRIYFYDSPKIKDGLFAGGQLSTVLRVDGDLITGPDGAEIVVQGCATAGQMAPGINATDQHQTLTEEMANAFVSGDRRLIGTVAKQHVLWAENFDLSLSINGTMDFGSATYGYSTVFSSEVGHTLTVSNRKRASGPLTISLTGANAGAFELSRTGIENIEMDSQDDFIVKTVRGLSAGVYTATVLVNGHHHVQDGFNVKFEVIKANLTISAVSATVVYGDEASIAANYQGLVNNETPADLDGALSFSPVYEPGINGVGSYMITPGGHTSNNYNIKYMPGGMLTVAKRPVTINVAAYGKEYDGNTTVSLSGMVLGNKYNGDDVTIVQGTAAFADKNAGYGKAVVFDGWAIGGSKADNYSLAGQPTAVADITQKDITISGDKIAYSGKAYDGTDAISGMTVIQLSPAFGIVDGEPLAASFTSAQFDSKNAGTRSITFEGLTLRGATADNYRLLNTTVVKEGVVISPVGLVIKADDKLAFVGETLPAFTYTATGFVDGETELALDEAPNIAAGPDYVNVPGVYTIVPSGAVSDNYAIEYINGILTVSDKEEINGSIVLDSATYVYDGQPHWPKAFYNDSDAHFTYTYAGVSNGTAYSGTVAPTAAGKYIVTAIYEDDTHIGKAMTIFTIDPKRIKIDSVAHTKEYNGARNASNFNINSLTWRVGDVADGDEISIAAVTSAMYASPNAGTTDLQIISVKLAGKDSANYSVDLPSNHEVEGIRSKLISSDMFTVVPQIYTGTERKPVPEAVADGAGNLATFRVDGYLANINAGPDAKVIVSGTGNYGGTATRSFTIGKAPLKVAAGSTITVYGDTANFKAFYYGLVNGETEVSLGWAPTFDFNYVRGDNVGDYDVMPGGITSNNYEIEYVGGTLTVEKRAAVINVTVKDTVYNGSTAVQILDMSVGNRYVNDDADAVAAKAGTAAFIDKNAGVGKTVVFEGWSLVGTKADNYYLIRQPSAKADITQREITVNPEDITYAGKSYDGTTSVNWLAVIPVSVKSGIIAGDVFAASYASAEFDTKDAGSRTVTFTGLSLRGADAGNYSLSSTAVTKNDVIITKRDLILKADDKLVFKDDPEPGYTYMLTGLVDGDTGDVITSEPQYALTPAYNASSVGRYTITPSGAVTANYNINYQTGILTISSKNDVSGDIVLEDSALVYDGTQKYPVHSYEGSHENFECRYVGVLARGGSYISTEPPIEVGAYIISLIYEDDNHIGKAMAAFKITPKPIAISGASHSKTYDGAKNAFGIAITLNADDIAEGDTVSATVKTAMYTGSSAGTTALQIIAVNMAGPDSLNYTVITPDTLRVAGIKRKPITAAMFSVASQVYTGTQRKPIPSAADGGLTVTFNIDGYSNNIEPGMAHMTVSGTGNYSGTQTLDFEIIRNSDGEGGGVVDDSTGTVVAQGIGNVTISGWTYRGYIEELNKPVTSSPTNDTINVVIEYKRSSDPDSAYKEWPALMGILNIDAGDYTIRATFPANEIYAACSDTADFTVAKASSMPHIPGIAKDTAGAEVLFISVPGVSGNILGISADRSGIAMVVGPSGVSFLANDTIPDFDKWQYSIDSVGGEHYHWHYNNADFPRLMPNSEYVILIRKNDPQGNYNTDSGMRALMLRTLAAGPDTLPGQNVVNAGYDNNSISLVKRIVSDKAEFTVVAPVDSKANIVIFDKLGNAVFRRSGVKGGDKVTWDIRGSGRAVADGSYLIVAKLRDKNGKACKSSAMVGVRK